MFRLNKYIFEKIWIDFSSQGLNVQYLFTLNPAQQKKDPISAVKTLPNQQRGFPTHINRYILRQNKGIAVNCLKGQIQLNRWFCGGGHGRGLFRWKFVYCGNQNHGVSISRILKIGKISVTDWSWEMVGIC